VTSYHTPIVILFSRVGRLASDLEALLKDAASDRDQGALTVVENCFVAAVSKVEIRFEEAFQVAMVATVAAAMVAATGNKRHPPHAVNSGIVSMQHLCSFLEPKVME